jgi:hypothetical protein
MRDEDLRRTRGRIARALLTIELLPGEPWSRIGARVGRTADQRRSSRVSVRVDVERRRRVRNLLALVDPLAATLSRSGLGRKAAREDLIVAKHGARLRPADPRDGPVGTSEVNRRGLRNLRGVHVERLGEALRLPCPALERPDEDLLASATLLRERRPRHASIAGRHRTGRQVGQTRVLPRIDRRRVIVDLDTRRQTGDRGVSARRAHQARDDREPGQESDREESHGVSFLGFVSRHRLLVSGAWLHPNWPTPQGSSGRCVAASCWSLLPGL